MARRATCKDFSGRQPSAPDAGNTERASGRDFIAPAVLSLTFAKSLDFFPNEKKPQNM
jgi:hypothetical protein